MKLETYLIKIKFLLFVACCLLLIASSVKAAILYLAPESQTVYQGESFIVELRIDSRGEEINTVGGGLIFPSELLRVVDFSKGGSILALWVQEPIVEQGEISFMGGAPGGFRGDGLIGKISFVGEGLGKAKVNLKEDSQVLLHDPQARPAAVSFSEGNYEIIERPEKLPQVTSESHPDQNLWYQETTFSLYWEIKEGAEYSWTLSFDPEVTPDEIPDTPEPKEGLVWMGAMGYENLKDGIYYFHLRQKLPGETWSEKVTRRAMIDSTPPQSFKPEIGQDPAVFEGRYFLGFATIDEMSGIDYYEVLEVKRHSFLEELADKKKEGEWKKAKSPHILEDQSLESQILVKAVDKAGNERIAQIFPPYKITLLDIVVGIVLLVILMGAIWWIIKKYLTKKHRAQNIKLEI